MKNKITLSIPQFNQIKPYSCIPACLQEVFGYYGKQISQKEIMSISKNPELGVALVEAGIFALRHNYSSLIITNNINIFDPTWFKLDNSKLKSNLNKRAKFVNDLNKFMINAYNDELCTHHLCPKTPVLEKRTNLIYNKIKQLLRSMLRSNVSSKINLWLNTKNISEKQRE